MVYLWSVRHTPASRTIAPAQQLSGARALSPGTQHQEAACCAPRLPAGAARAWPVARLWPSSGSLHSLHQAAAAQTHRRESISYDVEAYEVLNTTMCVKSAGITESSHLIEVDGGLAQSCQACKGDYRGRQILYSGVEARQSERIHLQVLQRTGRRVLLQRLLDLLLQYRGQWGVPSISQQMGSLLQM